MRRIGAVGWIAITFLAGIYLVVLAGGDLGGRLSDATSRDAFLVSVPLGVVVATYGRYGLGLLRRSNAERGEVLRRCVGKRLTLVTLQGSVFKSGMTGRIDRLDDHQVVIIWQGEPQAVPLAAIQEIWRGRRRLGRW